MTAQEVLLPLLCVRRHVHAHAEADGGAHDADGHAEVAGRADLHRVLRKEVPQIGKLCIVICTRQPPRRQRQLLRVLQHLVDAAARLDGAGDGEVTVHLEQEPAGDLGIVHLGKVPLHLRDGAQGRLDESLRLCGLGEGAADERGKTPKACGGIRDVRIGNDEL